MLNLGWRELFGSGSDESIVGKSNQDMYHIPSGLRDLIDKIIEEGIDYINVSLEGTEHAEDWEPEQRFDAVFNGLVHVSRMMAGRFYQLGQHMVTRLPYDKLTPCPCSTLVDDELDEFLKMAALVDVPLPDLKGEGFVIKNFDRSKKPE